MSSSIYPHLQLPAHVLVLLKRLMNVVSTLSISNECVNDNSRARASQLEAQALNVPVNGSVQGLIGVKQHSSTKTPTTAELAAAPPLKIVPFPKDLDSSVGVGLLSLPPLPPTPTTDLAGSLQGHGKTRQLASVDT